MTKEESGVTRRQAIGTIMIGAFGLFVAPNLMLLDQMKPVHAAPDHQPCGKAVMKSNMKVGFKIGEKFQYRGSVSKSAAVSAGGVDQAGFPTRAEIEGEPLPVDETITVAERQKYGKKNCYVIKRTGTVLNPLYHDGSNGEDRIGEMTSTAYVTPDGRILYCESKLVTRQGTSTSISINKNNDLEADATLHFFFGQWMLALSKDFAWNCKGESTNGKPESRSLRVRGIEKIAGHDCFVVDRSKKVGEDTLQVTYWIDTHERIVRQVETEGYFVRGIK